MILGNNGGDNGLYTLSGGVLNTGVNPLDPHTAPNPYNLGDVIVGLGGAGEIDQSGGTLNSESLYGVTLGFFGGSSGTYNLTGNGSLQVAANLDVGVGGQGTFNQGDGTGGTSVTVGGLLFISSGSGGAASAYTLTDGTLSVAGGEFIGQAAQGSFIQSGGTNNATGGVSIGSNPGGTGIYTLGGKGTLNARRLRRVRRRRGRRDGRFQL